MLQIDWKANPPVRRFREKRKDQTEREAGDDPDREHDKRLWKRGSDRRRRLVEDRHIRKCQLAFQLRLFRRLFPGVELLGAEVDVVLQLAQAVALCLEPRSTTSALALARPRAKRSGFASSRCALSDAGAFSRSPRQSACEPRRDWPVGPSSSDCWRQECPWRPRSRLRQSSASLSNPREFGDPDPRGRSIGQWSRWLGGFEERSARLWRSTTPGRSPCIGWSPDPRPLPSAPPYSSWLGRLEAPRAPPPTPYAIRRVAEQTTARFGRPQQLSSPPKPSIVAARNALAMSAAWFGSPDLYLIARTFVPIIELRVDVLHEARGHPFLDALAAERRRLSEILLNLGIVGQVQSLDDVHGHPLAGDERKDVALHQHRLRRRRSIARKSDQRCRGRCSRSQLRRSGPARTATPPPPRSWSSGAPARRSMPGAEGSPELGLPTRSASCVLGQFRMTHSRV